MSLFILIGLTLLSWWPLLAVVMIVGGIGAFLFALVTPERSAAPAQAKAPAKRQVRTDELVLEHDGEAVLELHGVKPADAVPAQRRRERTLQDAA